MQIRERLEIFELHLRQQSRAYHSRVVHERRHRMRPRDLGRRLRRRLCVRQIDADVLDLQRARLHVQRDHLLSALEQPLRNRAPDSGARAGNHCAIRGRVRNYFVSLEIISY